jgi:hypothetical protein
LPLPWLHGGTLHAAKKKKETPLRESRSEFVCAKDSGATKRADAQVACK